MRYTKEKIKLTTVMLFIFISIITKNRPLLKRVVFFEAAWGVAKIGSSLKSNRQIKFSWPKSATHCSRAFVPIQKALQEAILQKKFSLKKTK